MLIGNDSRYLVYFEIKTLNINLEGIRLSKELSLCLPTKAYDGSGDCRFLITPIPQTP